MGGIFSSDNEEANTGKTTPKEDDSKVEKLPVCYSDVYNIGFLGLEHLHPFDSKKYEKIYNNLINAKLVTKSQFVNPCVIDDETLKLIHPQKYLDSLQSSTTVARMIEVPPVGILPSSVVNKQVLIPMKAATNGSIIASEMAMKYGWAINLGGGFHHASAEDGGGFCIYADISLIIVNMCLKFGNNKSKKEEKKEETKEEKKDERKEDIKSDKNFFCKFMIVDLDAHQGNGHENDKVNQIYHKYGANVFIFDVYNQWIYPGDSYAKGAINKEGHIRVNSNVNDDEYLKQLKSHLPCALDNFKPDFVIYNAGTDCLEKDPLGQMSITESGIVERDFIVFDQVLKKRNIPLVMLLSGGYQQNNASVITRSITNLNTKFDLFKNPYQLKNNDKRENDQPKDDANSINPKM